MASPDINRVVPIPLANSVRVPVREAAWLIARVRFGTNCIYALHFEVTEDAVMRVTSIRFREQPEEKKYVACSHAVNTEMGLSGTGLTQGTAPTLEHRIMVTKAS